MSIPTRSAIPTTYAGVNFRSRLEARWAAFFDLVGWKWTYEPVDGDGYIPDFLIHGARPFFVEVGPVATEDEYRAKAAKPLQHPERPTLVVGVSYQMSRGDEHDPSPAGLIVNEFPASSSIGPAFWDVCDRGDLTYFGDDVARPCGHGWSAHVPYANLDDLWAQATNVVQWQPR